MTDVALFGKHPSAFHVVNTVYHACNATLLFLLLWLVLKNATGSAPFMFTRKHQRVTASSKRTVFNLLACAAGALFWAVHPLRVEPVAWIASRKDVLSLFWELLALLCWVRAVERNVHESSSQRSLPWAGASFTCFVLALLAKSTAMSFPLLAVLLEYLLTRRVQLRRLAPFLCVALVGAVISAIAQQAGGGTVALAKVPPYGRVLNAIASIGVYVRDTVWPTGLAVPYPHTWPALPLFFWPALGLCLFLGMIVLGTVGLTFFTSAQVWLRRTSIVRYFPILAVGLLWFLFSVAPMLGLVAFGYHSHADRFTYLPSIGFSLLLTGALITCLNRRSLAVRRLSWLTVLACLVLLARQTIRQTGYWKDGETLFTRTLQVTGENDIAHLVLGLHHFRTHTHLDMAIHHLGRYIEMTTLNVSFFHQTLYVLLLSETGQFSEAERQIRLLNERPEGLAKEKTVSSLLAYSAIALDKGDLELARQHLDEVLENSPALPEAHYLLGRLALKQGQQSVAEREWRLVLASSTLYDFLRTKTGN
jgi:hypothetical protein